MEIGKNIKANIRDRLAAIDLIAQGAEKDVSGFMNHLRKGEIVQAATSLASTKGEGTLAFVEKQAEISRRWLGTKR